MSEGHDLWGAIGELHRTREELIGQLADVITEGDVTCSFCGQGPPVVVVLQGPEAAICDRCVALCREILTHEQPDE